MGAGLAAAALVLEVAPLVASAGLIVVGRLPVARTVALVPSC